MYIQTEHLVLKNLSDGDAAAMIGLLTDSSIKKNYMLPDFENQEQALRLFDRLKALSASDAHYVAGIYLAGRLIGFLNDVQIANGQIELGYAIEPEHHNRGYASESLKAVIADLFAKGYQEVVTGAFSQNRASIRVMEKCGMTRLDKQEEIEYRGKVHQCVYYSIRNPNAGI